MTKVAMHHLSDRGVGRKIGYVHLSDTNGGLLLTPNLHSLSPGTHGFHIHQFGNVAPKNGTPGGMAGEHYDPDRTGDHLGPYGDGHRGDLPRLTVDVDGTATQPVLAPRLRLAEVQDRALVIHSGSDNYSDTPLPNGGGKRRIVGGIITNDCPYCREKTEKMLMLGVGAFLLSYLTLGRWTPQAIHNLADSLNIPWDNDPGFMALSEKVTGKRHLDDMTPRELKALSVALRS
jgi:Cu-Zn family superoxide dismutase